MKLSEIFPNHPFPWKLEPRIGKYYGTRILDNDDVEVIVYWTATGEPSRREKEYFGNWTEEKWNDYCSDTHWECEADLNRAEKLVAFANEFNS